MNRDNKNDRSLLSSVRSAALAADLPWRRIVTVLFTFFLAALTAGASLFGNCRPFALAVVAAAEGFSMTAAALAGTVLGAAGGRDFLPTAAAAGLLFLVRVTAALWIQNGRRDAADTRRNAVPASFGTRLRRAAGRAVSEGASENIRLRALFAAAAALCGGALSLFLGEDFSLRAVLTVFLSAAAAPAVTAAFCTLSVRQLARTGARDAGMCVLLFAVVRALRDAAGLPFSAGVIAAFAAAVLAARGTGRGVLPRSDAGRIMNGVLCGVVAGFAIDPGGPPLYAAAALAAGIVFPLSPAAAVCAGWICAMGISFAGGGLAAFAAVMPEMTVTAAILVPLLQFGLIPAPRTQSPLGVSHGTAVLRAELECRRAEHATGRMHTLAASFRSVAEVIASLSEKFSRPPLSQVRRICESAFDERCADCENRILCRERECATMDDTICRLSVGIHREGRVSAAAVPPPLARRCHRLDGILAEIEEQWSDCARSARDSDKSDVLAEDYASFAALLEEAAVDAEDSFAPDEDATARLRRGMTAMDLYAGEVTVLGSRRRRVLAEDLDLTKVRMANGELRTALEEILGCPLSEPEYRIDGQRVSMRLESVPRLRLSEGSFSRAAGEDNREARRVPPNGDCVLQFETADGRYYMLICDGMGTGGEASVTARLSAAFLEEVLSGGAQMNAALTMLNGCLRHRNLECSAGIDLMEIDRYTGEARFVKSGAAPSFVLRDGRLFRLCSKTVPIGILRALDAEMIRFALQPGDAIVMLSDGVSENFEDSAWLCDMLASPAVMAGEPEEIAQKIVCAAVSGEGRRDDVTAAVVKVA